MGDWKRIGQVERQAARSSLKGWTRPVGAGPELTGSRGPMVHEGLPQGGKRREETSVKELVVRPGCGAPSCDQPL